MNPSPSSTAGAGSVDPIKGGSALFDAAFKAAKGSYAGTIAVIAGTTAGLSPNEINTHLTRVVAMEANVKNAGQRVGSAALAAAKTATETIVTGAAASGLGALATATSVGAAIGNIIPVPGVGAAIGAVVGLIVGIFTSLFGSDPPQAPEGDFRSPREQRVFPPLYAKKGQMSLGVNPGTWPDIRTHASGYQMPAGVGVTDPISGQDCPVPYNFATGYIPPPKSTPASAQCGWLLANIWASRSQRRYFPNAPNQPARLKQEQTWKASAAKLLGSEAAVERCLDMMTHWYAPANVDNGLGHGFNISAPNFPPFGAMNSYGQFTGFPVENFETFAHWFFRETSALNTDRKSGSALDYVYYISETAYLRKDHGQWFAHNVDPKTYAADQASSHDTNSGFALLAMPDTTLWGLGDFAFMFEKGYHPKAGADVIILSWVAALAWGWRTGALIDLKRNPTYVGKALAEKNHENFSRLIWIMFTHVKAATLKAAPAAGKSTAPTHQPAPAAPTHGVDLPSKNVGAQLEAGANETPWGLVLLGLAGIALAAKVVSDDSKRKG